MTYAALTFAAASSKKSPPFHFSWFLLAALLLATAFGPRLL